MTTELTESQEVSEPRQSECCYITPTGFQCGTPPEWRICWGSFGPDEYTESCTRHVGDVLTDASEHRIFPLTGLNTLMP